MDMDNDVGRNLYFHEQPEAEQRREVTRERMTSDWPHVGGMWIGKMVEKASGGAVWFLLKVLASSKSVTTLSQLSGVRVWRQKRGPAYSITVSES